MRFVLTLLLFLSFGCATLPYDNTYVKETQISPNQYKIVCTNESNCIYRAKVLCQDSYKVDSLNQSVKTDIDLACTLLKDSKDDSSQCEPKYTEHILIVTCL